MSDLALTLWCRGSFVTALTIFTLLRREHQFSQIMSSNRNLNRGRYYRLVALSGVEALGTVPLASYLLYRFMLEKPTPWKSWSKTHSGDNYSKIVQVPSSVWKAIPYVRFAVESRWFYVLCAFIFFAFFGFADEARQHYRLAFKSIATRVGLSTSSLTLNGSSSHGYVVHYFGPDSSSTYL